MPKNLGNSALPEAWLFDLDNTLYSPATGLFDQVRARITGYLRKVLGFAPQDCIDLQERYRIQYGSTLSGLLHEHDADSDHYLAFVHEVDYSVVPRHDALDEALARLPGRKFIFTSGTTAHAQRVLERLGVVAHFLDIFDIAASAFEPKPMPGPYRTIVERFALDPARTVFIDDIPRNLPPAKAVGMATVLMAPGGAPDDLDGIDDVVDDLVDWLGRFTGGD